jgi:hypothetical protein
MDQQQTERTRQNPPIDVSQESEKPARRKKNAKPTRRTQHDPQTPAATDELKAKASDSSEVIAASPPTANNVAQPIAGAAGLNFIADPEPVLHGPGFVCTFTLSRPGLVGLNKLAIYLNDLQDSGSISGWQASGWEDAATKVRALIGFANRTDAITAIKSVQ